METRSTMIRAFAIDKIAESMFRSRQMVNSIGYSKSKAIRIHFS
jgi:hypothetical protein